jgi:putative endonuclease
MNRWLKRTSATDNSTRKIGEKAELLAQSFLEDRGLDLVTRNYHCRRGEIDLIMRDGNFLVFIEVRYRKSNIYGSAAESITRQKQSRLLTTAEYYLQNEMFYGDNSCRFDVITVSGQYNPQIEWIKNAFQAEYD